MTTPDPEFTLQVTGKSFYGAVVAPPELLPALIDSILSQRSAKELHTALVGAIPGFNQAENTVGRWLAKTRSWLGLPVRGRGKPSRHYLQEVDDWHAVNGHPTPDDIRAGWLPSHRGGKRSAASTLDAEISPSPVVASKTKRKSDSSDTATIIIAVNPAAHHYNGYSLALAFDVLVSNGVSPIIATPDPNSFFKHLVPDVEMIHWDGGDSLERPKEMLRMAVASGRPLILDQPSHIYFQAIQDLLAETSVSWKLHIVGLVASLPDQIAIRGAMQGLNSTNPRAWIHLEYESDRWDPEEKKIMLADMALRGIVATVKVPGLTLDQIAWMSMLSPVSKRGPFMDTRSTIAHRTSIYRNNWNLVREPMTNALKAAIPEIFPLEIALPIPARTR